ncbi:MAG: DUF1751 domain-containing protein [Armatimonadetes bacterium]|nr:DUF1751 domain-containing protein [Armatimonadota bacterium]
MIGYTPAEKFKYWLFQDKIPLTKILILSNLITFLAIRLFHVSAVMEYMSFSPLWVLKYPWTVLTYPFIGTCCPTWGPIGLLFSLYWLWVAGGSLERSWGFGRYSVYLFSVTVLSALGIFIGGYIISLPVPLAGLLLPLSCITISFAMLNPEQEIILIIIPMKLKYLAILDFALTFISYGQYNLILGLFALSGCTYAYWYVMRPTRISAPASKNQGDIVRVFGKRSIWRMLNPFAWIKEWNDKRKLKKFFDKSDFKD